MHPNNNPHIKPSRWPGIYGLKAFQHINASIMIANMGRNRKEFLSTLIFFNDATIVKVLTPAARP
jgi:hypothetical protein